MTNDPVKTGEDAFTAVPSVVYLIVVPGVAHEMDAVTSDAYIELPANVGVPMNETVGASIGKNKMKGTTKPTAVVPLKTWARTIVVVPGLKAKFTGAV
jgi:hypothetical protein